MAVLVSTSLRWTMTCCWRMTLLGLFLLLITILGISGEEISGFSALSPLNLSPYQSLIHRNIPVHTKVFEFCVTVSVRTFGVMYYHTLFYACMQFTRSDIRPHVKLAISLVIVDGHLSFLRGFVGLWLNIVTLSPPRVHDSRTNL